MDDHQDPEDIPPRPEPAGTVASGDRKPKRIGVDERGEDSGPDASEAPEEEGSASPG
ncbi:MAG TPA: hypothetical protein VI814_12035 [Candidatus Limnocylindria bacterium]